MGRFDVGAKPDPFIAARSLAYQAQNGLRATPRAYSSVVMPSTATRALSDAYQRMPDFDQRAVPAYRAMREETNRQMDFLTKPRAKGGLGMDVEVTRHDPYGSASYHDVIGDLRNDVQNNNRIKVLATASTGGHPFFTNDENDAFRAVHDVFGHLGSGRGVDRHGEEAAFQKHAAMFSPLARAAMATETRGQNGYLHGAGGGNFGEQKVGLLPAALRRLNFESGFRATAEDHAQALRQNQNQGLADG